MMMMMKQSILLLLFLASFVANAEDLNMYYDQGGDGGDCENPISYTYTCSQTSLCNQLMGDDDSVASPSTLCYRVRSCFLGYCATSDWVETEEVESVCALAYDEDQDEGSEELCIDDWDSSWWMTDYVEAADCSDSTAIYLECTESVGDVSSSTTASLGFSAVGVAVLVGLWMRSKGRRRQLAVVSNNNNTNSKVDDDAGTFVTMSDATSASTEMTASNFERLT